MIYNTVTYSYYKDWRKHGPFEGFDSEEEYVEAQLQKLSRLEFLEQISDAIEERLELYRERHE